MKQNNKANSYKKKIQKLTGSTIIQNQDQHIQPVNQALKNNKILSARQTRIRKKIYINLLEQKLQKKQDQIDKLTTELQKLKQQKFAKNSNAMYQSLKIRTQLFKKVQQSLKNQDQNQINNYLDILRLRYGISGDERAILLDSTLKQFIQFLMPMHFRYLMQYCNQKKQFYELFSDNEQYKIHMNFNFLNYDQKKQLAKIRPLLLEHKQIYNVLIQKIVDLKKIVLSQNEIAQKIIDNLRKAFKPSFVAQFLLKLDQKRTCDQRMKQIYPLNEWEQCKKQKKLQQQKKIAQELYNLQFSSKQIKQGHFFTINQQQELDYLL